MPHKPLCVVPFIEAFGSGTGGFRNCCSTAPAINSEPGQQFQQWWISQPMQDFRAKFYAQQLPPECYKCDIEERMSGQSMRLAINATHDAPTVEVTWPSRWNVIFGNLCNLSCWSCNEHYSSVIETHKRRLEILPLGFQSPQDKFLHDWPGLRDNILESYQHHDIVTITLLGGEPLFNPVVLEFLQLLIDQGLCHRTNLEFHTNGTKFNHKIQALMDQHQWNHMFVFVSLDAVGKKAEWLRYGCDWNQIQQNLQHIRQQAEYVEVHCILSILNILDLPELKKFCESQQIRLQITLLSDPWYMDMRCWDAGTEPFAQLLAHDASHDVVYYQGLVGQTPRSGARQALVDYIKQFDHVRRPLVEFDPVLSNMLFVS